MVGPFAVSHAPHLLHGEKSRSGLDRLHGQSRWHRLHDQQRIIELTALLQVSGIHIDARSRREPLSSQGWLLVSISSSPRSNRNTTETQPTRSTLAGIMD